MAHVYYLSYGSNMHRERMMVYINGGQHNGTTVHHPGSSDKTEPADCRHITVDGWRLIYAYQSRGWGGAVCGIVPADDADLDSGHQIHAVIYKISRQQFSDVVSQENGAPAGALSSFELPREEGTSQQVLPGPYGLIVHMGDHEGVPIYTFTHPSHVPTSLRVGHRPPTPAYLKTMYDGLRSHGVDHHAIVNYFLSARGVTGFLSQKQITTFVKQ